MNNPQIKILGIIPARYASTRFPGKPLAGIGGKSMVQRVYEQARKCTGLDSVIVATDHSLIYDHVKSFGGLVCMTSVDHASGTDRCFELLSLQKEQYDYVVNIQGDEPFIDPQQIDLLVSLLDGKTELATLIKKIEHQEQLFNTNVVKVIFNQHKEAIYFSRAALPHIRNKPPQEWLNEIPFFKHIGLYAYRADVLKKISGLPVSMLEKAESLEQLRWLENGFTIRVAATDIESEGIDTPADLVKALELRKISERE